MTPEEFLEPRTPDVRDLAMRTCALVREVMPDAIGEVHPGRNNIIFGSGRKMAEWICYVSPMNNYVNLGFLRGTELPDPKGLLEGTGKLLRHVKIRSAKDLEKSALRTLIMAARDTWVLQIGANTPLPNYSSVRNNIIFLGLL